MAGIRRFVLNENGLGGGARSQGWDTILDGVCEVEHTPDLPHQFAGVASVSAAVTFAMNLPLSRASLGTARATGVDVYCITLVTSGTRVIENGRSNGQRLRPGDCYLLDLSAAWSCASVDAEPLGEISVYMPLQALMLRSAQFDTRGWFKSGESLLGSAIGSLLRVLGQQVFAADADILAPCTSAIRDMVLGDLRKTSGGARPVERPNSKLDDVRRFIDRHIRSDALTPDLIAADFGLSRATLQRMFEPLGGVAGYIRRQRMAFARQDLTGSRKERVSIVAHRYGYQNVAAFTRAFRQTYGKSPRDLAKRRTIEGGQGSRLIDLLAPLCTHAPRTTV